MNSRFAMLLLLVSTMSLMSCSRAANESPEQQQQNAWSRPRAHSNRPARAMKANDWQGVYTSPLEIGGFSGTILVIEDEPTIRPALAYRQKSYSDVVLDEPIQQDEESGECLSQGDNLFIPRAYSYSVREGVRLGAGITRYTRMNINGYQILMRDDALKHFQRDQSLYDYGILIKVRDTPVSDLNFDTIERKSIRVLQKDSAPPWKDPFVHGPNSSS